MERSVRRNFRADHPIFCGWRYLLGRSLAGVYQMAGWRVELAFFIGPEIDYMASYIGGGFAKEAIEGQFSDYGEIVRLVRELPLPVTNLRENVQNPGN